MKRSLAKLICVLGGVFWLALGSVNVHAQPAPGTADFDPTNPPTQTMVMRGETLFNIAERTRSPLQGLIRANNLTPPFAIKPGQILVLPPLKVHVVASGDTFLAIARRYSVDERSLAVFNRLKRPVQVRVGQRIILPPMVVDRFTGLEPQDLVDLLANEIGAGRQVTGAIAGQIVRNSEAAPAISNADLPSLSASPPDPAIPVVGPTIDAMGNVAVPSAIRATGHGPSEDGDGVNVAGRPSSLPKSAAKPINSHPTTRTASLSPTIRPPLTRPPSARPTPARPTPALPSITDMPSSGAPSALIWPINGRVIETFGTKRDFRTLDGIEIEAPAGTPFRAAANGTVAYVGNQLVGYGWLVLIRHPDGVMSAYAYAQSVNVRENQIVTRGQVIGLVGTTGRARTPRLHFQIRQNTHPVDPLQRLPRVRAAA
jgi:murein DD-endopeptidase MepM/ murein hydrolase activator NlpD